MSSRRPLSRIEARSAHSPVLPLARSQTSPVATLARNYVAYSACRVRNVTSAARDKVDVAVEDGLPCDLTFVYSDVEPLHALVRPLNGHLLLLQEPVAGIRSGRPSSK